MRTNFEQMRHNLLLRAGIVPRDKAPFEGRTWQQIRALECDDNFAVMMDNRLVMGFLRYGPIATKKPEKYDLTRARQRLDDYEKTGNTEFLVDAANYCRLELKRGMHPKKHFHAMDRA